jgi:hypothetical protein
MPEMPENTQDIISSTSKLYRSNAELKVGELDAEKEGKIFSDQVLMRNGEVVSEAAYPDQRFMLGSITKLFIFRAIANALKQAGISSDDEIFPLNVGFIRELINRGHLGYILAHADIYGSVIEWFNQFELPEDVIQGLQSPDIRVKDAAIARISELKTDWNKFEFPQVNISFAELCHWALQVSADSPLAVARSYYYQNLEHTYKDLQEAVAAQVPSLEVTESTANFQHWIQRGPNTVQLPDLTMAMDKFAAESVEDSFDEAIHDSVTNNPISYGFSISGSEAAQEWQAQGYQVVEKTGFYPTVIWIRNLAEQGFPAHMAIASAVSVIAPDRQRCTVGLQMSVEIALPKEMTKFGYPDESSPDYQQYIEAMKAKYFPIFRAKLVELVEQAL